MELAHRARTLWKDTHTRLRGRLYRAHIHSHTAHIWNDRVDELADLGAAGKVSVRGGPWLLYPWSREHTHNIVARVVVRVQRVISTHVAEGS